MSSSSVLRLFERLASEPELQERFKACRQTVLADMALDAAERLALETIDAEALIATLDRAVPRNLTPNARVAAGGIANPGIAYPNPGIANPGIGAPGIANPGIANPKAAGPSGIVKMTGEARQL